jgi:hypothetical protein
LVARLHEGKTVPTPLPDDFFRSYAVLGHVIGMTTEGGAESIDEMSLKYHGTPYPNFRGQPETRVVITIEADSVTAGRG